MTNRISIYALAQAYQLSADKTAALLDLAERSAHPPEQQNAALFRLIAVLGAALFGFGIILWIAANWADLARMTKFGLLSGCFVAAILGAVTRPGARNPLLLLAFLLQGGVFAYFGQTYQTGADPWQLFALWAALGLPLALAARSDLIWVPLAVVVVTGATLWTHAHTGRAWRLEENSANFYFVGWSICLALSTLLAPRPAMQRWTGAQAWAFRTSVSLATITILFPALEGLFAVNVLRHYPLGLAALGSGIALLVWSNTRDALALSVLALGINILLFAGLFRLLDDRFHSHWTLLFLIFGLSAAVMVAGTVSGIRWILNRNTVSGDDFNE